MVKKLNLILNILFLIITILIVIILIKDINSSISYKFIIGYAVFLLIYCLLLLYKVIFKLRKLKRTEIKKRALKFIILFFVFSSSNFIFNYIFRPSEIGDLNFSTALGFSLGLAFFDLAFLNKKET